MSKKSKKVSYSFSFTPAFANKLKHYKNTHPGTKLSQQVERHLDLLIPDIE